MASTADPSASLEEELLRERSEGEQSSSCAERWGYVMMCVGLGFKKRRK